jgi:pimeloyl-ACP methyl ester carboxylesterase
MLLLMAVLFISRLFAAEEVREFPADPAKGFHWPYFLVVPAQPVCPTFLVVEPNNSGTGKDDPAFHNEMARKAILRSTSNAAFRKLGFPYLVPAFPRPASQWQYYTHALDRDTLAWRVPDLKRIDLQLIAMIQDARRRLAEAGVPTEERVFLWGYSAAGSFTIRFTILHPELVQAASLGGCSVPTLPLAKVNGHKARYPIGVADLKQLTGRQFRARAFRSVPIQIFRGSVDNNDEVAYDDGYDLVDREFINRELGGPPPIHRYPTIQDLYRRSAPRVRFIVEPGVAHNDALTRKETPVFFEQHRLAKRR